MLILGLHEMHFPHLRFPRTHRLVTTNQLSERQCPTGMHESLMCLQLSGLTSTHHMIMLTCKKTADVTNVFLLMLQFIFVFAQSNLVHSHQNLFNQWAFFCLFSPNKMYFKGVPIIVGALD